MTIAPSSNVHARARGVTSSLVLALCLLLTGCSGGSPTDKKVDPTSTDTVPAAKTDLAQATWVLEGEPASLDPIYDYAYFDNTVIANMCEPLVRLNADLTTENWLATAKMVDPTTWTYDLRPGVTFWDGSPVTPADVVYSLKRNMDPNLGSYFSSTFYRVKDVTQSGPMQVTVKLTKPDAQWNDTTMVQAGNYIVSKKFAEVAGKKFGSAGTGVMCTGPYKFDRWAPGDSITMSKNTNYWNHDFAPKTAQIKFVFLEDSSAQANALTSDQAQGMYVRDPGIISRLKDSGGHVYYGPGLTYQFVIPTAKQGPLSNVKIRQALSMALDRKAIADKIFDGAAVPIKTLAGPDSWGPDPKVSAVYKAAYASYASTKPDVAAARKLVDAAGSPTDRLVLAYPTQGGDYQLKLATVIQATAKEIGLNMVLKPLSPSVAASLYQDPDAMVKAGIDLVSVFFNLNSADPFGMYQIFDPAANNVYNYSHFESPTATQYLEAASTEYDAVKRAENTVKAQKIIMGGFPMIPLVSNYAVLYLGRSVTGPPASFSQIFSAWAPELGGS